MTAKEEARELVNKFLSIEGSDDCGNSYPYIAIQCALICVDEILKSHYKVLVGVLPSIERYYKEVKEEIKKL